MFCKGKYSCENCKLKAHIRVLLYYTIENFAGAIHAQGCRTVWKSGWGKTSKRKRFCWCFWQNLGKRLPLPSPRLRRSFTNNLRYLKTGRKCRPPGFFQGKTAGGQVGRTHHSNSMPALLCQGRHGEFEPGKEQYSTPNVWFWSR